MNSYIQLLCIVISLAYGVLLKIDYDLLNKVFKKNNIVFKSFFYVLLIILSAFIYLFLMYKINGGIINAYFYLLILAGFVFVCVKKRKL